MSLSKIAGNDLPAGSVRDVLLPGAMVLGEEISNYLIGGAADLEMSGFNAAGHPSSGQVQLLHSPGFPGFQPKREVLAIRFRGGLLLEMPNPLLRIRNIM